MNRVPVADQRQAEQEKCDQQQPCGFRRINRMPVMPVGCIILGFGELHTPIVSLMGSTISPTPDPVNFTVLH